MQTGVCTDHCNYGALRESSFLCRFICHINKGISSMYGGWWQQEKFEKINELWQCCTWGEKSVAISYGLCWHRVWQYERGRWREASDCCRLWSYIVSPKLSCHLIRIPCLWSLTLSLSSIPLTNGVPTALAFFVIRGRTEKWHQHVQKVKLGH